MALSASLSLAATPTAPANELGDRKQRVHREISQAQKELRHSSEALIRASARVAKTEEKLAAAEAELDRR
ncbi:MAG TPA: hypothetical protein VFY11_16270, partial [Nocardioidaceae bacterium]|nr:hypothetical protein [Nocardioidaceae bacterium]